MTENTWLDNFAACLTIEDEPDEFERGIVQWLRDMDIWRPPVALLNLDFHDIQLYWTRHAGPGDAIEVLFVTFEFDGTIRIEYRISVPGSDEPDEQKWRITSGWQRKLPEATSLWTIKDIPADLRAHMQKTETL